MWKCVHQSERPLPKFFANKKYKQKSVPLKGYLHETPMSSQQIMMAIIIKFDFYGDQPLSL